MKYQKQPGRSKAPAPDSGRWVLPEPSDRYRYANAASYTPQRLGEIIAAANSGDTEQLCVCAREILERNWDVIAALDQRAEALLGAKWEILPGGNGPNDKAAAEAFRAQLEKCGALTGLDTFYDLVRNLEDAVVYPFAVSEIIWEPGGSISGFQHVDPWHFTLRDSYVPMLVSDEHPNGELPQKYKYVFHQSRKTVDPARSGRIRVLAWLHLFQNWPIKDLFSFVERFGMPFVVAKVDRKTWDDELAKVQRLIKSFGPSGGGVFTKSMEVELLQAANTGSDNIYLKILEYTREAIYRLLLGQTASSSGGGGLSGDTAQSEVRQDILESDARAVEATIYAQIAAPWTGFNFGPSAAVPRIHFKVEPPEDMAAFTTMLQGVYNSGFLADPAEVGKKVGLTLTLKPEPPQVPGMGFGLQTPAEATAPDAAPLAADPKKKSGEPDKPGAAEPRFVRVGFEEMYNGGPAAGDKKKSEERQVADALVEWLTPLSEALPEVTDEREMSDEAFGKALAACADGKRLGDLEPLIKAQEGLIYRDLAESKTEGMRK